MKNNIKESLIRLAAVSVAIIVTETLISLYPNAEYYAALVLADWFLWFTFVMFSLVLLSDYLENLSKGEN